MSALAVVPADTPPVYGARELLRLYTDEVTAIASMKASGMVRGATTGLAGLDRLLGGFLPAGLYVIHGEPGSGKSALAYQMATDCGCAALYVTTEMAPLELVRRHVARKAPTPRRALLDGVIGEAKEIGLATVVLKDGCPYILDACSTQATAGELSTQIQLIRALEHSTHLMLVIDSLHSWAAPLAANEGLTEYEALNEAMMALRGISATYSVAVIVLAERNRVSMKSGGMAAVAGTRRVEYGADVLMELSRDDPGDRGQSGVERINLKITKNRLGPAGAEVPLAFQGDVMNFTEVDLRWQ